MTLPARTNIIFTLYQHQGARAARNFNQMPFQILACIRAWMQLREWKFLIEVAQLTSEREVEGMANKVAKINGLFWERKRYFKWYYKIMRFFW